VRHDSFICESWLIHMWDMTHSYVRHDSFIWEIRLFHMGDMTHSYVRHDSFICETWLIHMWDKTHSYVRHEYLTQSSVLLAWRGWVLSYIDQSYELFMSHIWMRHVTYEWVISNLDESCHTWKSHITYEWVMSRVNESCHTWMHHVTYARIMSHIWTIHFAQKKWMSRVRCHLFWLVLLPAQGLGCSALRFTFEVLFYLPASQFRVVFKCATWARVWRDRFLCVTWIVSQDKTRSCKKWYVTCLIHMNNMTNVTWLIRMCDMTCVIS